MLSTLTDPAVVTTHKLPAGWRVAAVLDQVDLLHTHTLRIPRRLASHARLAPLHTGARPHGSHHDASGCRPGVISLTLRLQVASRRPAVHALIDAGALVTGYSNREVAQYLLPRLGSELEGVVYLDHGGNKTILLRAGGTMALERCGLPKERRFSFFDQVRTAAAPRSHGNTSIVSTWGTHGLLTVLVT